jgi:hypothetical protein
MKRVFTKYDQKGGDRFLRIVGNNIQYYTLAQQKMLKSDYPQP